MSAHSRQPVRAEAVLAMYSHARSSRVAEFTFAHPEALAAVGVFVLVVAMRYPVLAAVLAGAMAVGLTHGHWVGVEAPRGRGDVHTGDPGSPSQT